MADKLPSYVVPATRRPSFFNSSAAVGLVAGSLTLNPFMPLIGAAIGAFVGKKQMEKQLDNGKTVSPPSMLNKGAFMGAALCIGPALAGGALTGGISLIPSLAMAAVGGLIGGKINKSMQAKQYRKAENYIAENGPYTSPREMAQQQVAMQQGMGQAPAQAQGMDMAQAAQQLDPQQLAQLQALAAQGQSMGAQPEGSADRLAAQQRNSGPQQR